MCGKIFGEGARINVVATARLAAHVNRERARREKVSQRVGSRMPNRHEIHAVKRNTSYHHLTSQHWLFPLTCRGRTGATFPFPETTRVPFSCQRRGHILKRAANPIPQD